MVVKFSLSLIDFFGLVGVKFSLSLLVVFMFRKCLVSVCSMYFAAVCDVCTYKVDCFPDYQIFLSLSNTFSNSHLFLKFYFMFKLYNIVLVLPNIEMNLPQVYMCSPS